jgi:NADPH-dependent FMN reductase
MKTAIRIHGIAGSLRRGSYDRAALQAATELAPKGATIEMFELDGIPPFIQDEEQNPAAKVAELKRRMREANAILFVTPEYNWSGEELRVRAYYRHKREAAGRELSVNRSINQNLLSFAVCIIAYGSNSVHTFS